MWALDASFEWLDSIFRVRCQDPGLGEHLGRLLETTKTGNSSKRPRASYTIRTRMDGFELYRGRHTAAAAGPADRIVEALVTDLNRTALAAFSGFASHAGVVAHDGTAVVLPAASGGGKSTLTAACVLEGFDYVSDEALCLTFDEPHVVPYPRPIGLTPWSLEALRIADRASVAGESDAYVGAAELGGVVATGALVVGHVVLIERRDSEPTLTPIPRSEVLASLIRLSFNHYKRPRRSFEIVGELASRCRSWRLAGGDPLAAADLLHRELLG